MLGLPVVLLTVFVLAMTFADASNDAQATAGETGVLRVALVTLLAPLLGVGLRGRTARFSPEIANGARPPLGGSVRFAPLTFDLGSITSRALPLRR